MRAVKAGLIATWAWALLLALLLFRAAEAHWVVHLHLRHGPVGGGPPAAWRIHGLMLAGEASRALLAGAALAAAVSVLRHGRRSAGLALSVLSLPGVLWWWAECDAAIWAPSDVSLPRNPMFLWLLWRPVLRAAAVAVLATVGLVCGVAAVWCGVRGSRDGG
jgi:hypothetical protein